MYYVILCYVIIGTAAHIFSTVDIYRILCVVFYAHFWYSCTMHMKFEVAYPLN